MMKNLLFLSFLILGLIACSGNKEEAKTEKDIDAAMSEIEGIENLEEIDALSEELGDFALEAQARQAEIDSLLKEEEKDAADDPE